MVKAVTSVAGNLRMAVNMIETQVGEVEKLESTRIYLQGRVVALEKQNAELAKYIAELEKRHG